MSIQAHLLIYEHNYLLFNLCEDLTNKYMYLLLTEFEVHTDLWPARRARAINHRGKKTRIHNLQYGLRRGG